MNFCLKLCQARRDQGLSQEKLAEIIGVSRQAIAKWEQGEAWPEIENLILLSNYFQLSIDSLLKADQPCAPNQSKPALERPQDLLTAFLCRAKKACYAGGGAETAASRLNSHDLAYAEAEFTYYDSYLGGELFAGEEAVWVDQAAVWSMNYQGRVLDGQFSGEFLKECLGLVAEDMPFRGPLVHGNGKFLYHCTLNGSFSWFHGTEDIFYEQTKVYECMFHGGSLR